ncbi:xanthine dehydrogenase family protein molybdopterin-binding subunit [Chryseobacterium wangxinyae]|uniref:xanthine dehydrogenase family protein molybdopterin-binding subunit n=1 Tax=Chryseobacterium sp. CY350 TaxID=2997336 RepID=UPI0022705EFF|nr:xanthine dehydrogenase family protein molybdopterin-binding subunit [Chryseobacterium sp. CY350]MCY0978230.1 xanthine dehydrogenase family protein molybdopterin-binding subunit [Chryseobacterium sp. CY350]WBZ96010.1 xanthine dehydrogenase family protein molybdopterin-binding subunit [Chryseobacterium sp. CY350]
MGFFDDETAFTVPSEGRVEALAKVRGQGKYAAEYKADNLCYAVLVTSEIASGKIKAINIDQAKQAEGILDIISHLRKPAVPGFATEAKIKESKFGLPVFYTDTIYFKGQPVALVIAETLEEATYAASLVKVEYSADSFEVDFNKAKNSAELKPAGKERGDEKSWSNSPFFVDQEYGIAAEIHNPMEMHATIADWYADNKLRIFDKNQGVNSVQKTFAGLFEIPVDNIQVISEFVGGGFGSGLRVWPHALAAILGAKQVKRPVKLMLTRPQMFHSVGYRPASWQRVKLGANKEGKITGVLHQAKNGCAIYDPFSEGITRVSRLIYQFDNLKTDNAVVPLNLSAPTWMRGPGDCTGDFAIESALDEMSYQLKIDPVALRYKNLALEKNPETGLPWSTNYLKEAIEKGSKMIGWNLRKPNPGAISEGDWKIGYGMAVGMWNAGRNKASAGIKMTKDGNIVLQSAMTDIGTGTGTGMQNIMHESSGISKNKITIELGNSDLPPAGSQGGSTGLSSISGAVVAVSDALKLKLAEYASVFNQKFKNANIVDIILSDKGVSFQKEGGNFISYEDIFNKNNLKTIDVEATSEAGEEKKKFSFCSSAAHFCRVKVNIKTGKVVIDKMVVVVDGGKIINEKPAANQISGAAVGGIGMALMEKTSVDEKVGGLIANDLAGYHFPVNADAPIIEVAFINKPDNNLNPSGAKGLGEVGIIGAAPAIANAIFNATGKRFRNLPITPDLLIQK